jgi:hypothetical protein
VEGEIMNLNIAIALLTFSLPLGAIASPLNCAPIKDATKCSVAGARCAFECKVSEQELADLRWYFKLPTKSVAFDNELRHKIQSYQAHKNQTQSGNFDEALKKSIVPEIESAKNRTGCRALVDSSSCTIKSARCEDECSISRVELRRIRSSLGLSPEPAEFDEHLRARLGQYQKLNNLKSYGEYNKETALRLAPLLKKHESAASEQSSSVPAP